MTCRERSGEPVPVSLISWNCHSRLSGPIAPALADFSSCAGGGKYWL